MWALVVFASVLAVRAYGAGSATGFSVTETEQVLLPPDHRIRYTGLVQQMGDITALGWTSTQISATFRGTAVYANLSGSGTGDRFLVLIDGKPGQTFLTVPHEWRRYQLATGLQDSEHIVKLWKLSEDWTGIIGTQGPDGLNGTAFFGGFFLAPGASFGEQPVGLARRLLFIGDSDTAAFCCDGDPNLKGFPQDPIRWYNSYENWGAQIARGANAEYIAQAISGIGITTNSMGIELFGPSMGKMSQHLRENLPFRLHGSWDSPAPDAVIIMIGGNDNNCSSNLFGDEYVKFMKQVADVYHPKLKLITACGGSMTGWEPCAQQERATEVYNSKYGNYSFFASMDYATHQKLISNKSFQGCVEHFNPHGHAAIAKEILPQVMKIMGWDDSELVQRRVIIG